MSDDYNERYEKSVADTSGGAIQHVATAEEKTMQDDFGHVWAKRHEVLYRVELSGLYHQKRERFFDSCDKAVKAIAVIGGSWLLARLGGADAMLIVAAVIVVTSTLSLMLGLSDLFKPPEEPDGEPA